MIVVATVTTLDIRHVLLLYNVKAQCLIPYILLFSKPQLQAAPQRYRHGVTLHLRPHRVGRATTTLYASRCQAVQILLLQRSCKPFIVSSVTPPCIKKYIRGQDPVVLCTSEFFKLYCCLAFGRQSPGDVVARPFR